MAYTNFQHCTANEYKNIVYNQETNNKIKILFNNVELEDADEYCESFEVVSRVIPNGSKIFMLENLVSQEATLVLHNIDTSIIQDQVSISIGTLVSENTYEYVPIGIYNLQEIPTTDNGKTTIKLRDNSVKLDFNYNAKPLIDEHGGTATKLQILQDICSQANITCNVSSFIGSSDLIGIYDNTITGRQYVAYLAGSAGAIPIITRSGALDFKYLNNLSTIEIPIEIVEQYSNAENFKISRVVYEDAIRKYESGNETYDTLFLDSANPYISSQQQVASIYNIVNNFEINSFKTGRILGNPAIDSYDLIQITDYDGTIFKTFANNTLRYNGKMINTFASEISFERKKGNVSLKSGATFKKWAKTEIDNANAQITIQAGQIEEIEQELSSPTSTKENKYFDLEDALDSPLIDFSLYGDTQQDTTILPSEYQQVEYIQSSGTQYINTNYISKGTLNFQTELEVVSTPTSNLAFFGGRDAYTSNTNMLLYDYANSKFRNDYNNTNNATSNVSSLVNRWLISKNRGALSIKSKDGTQTYSATLTNSTFTSSYTVYIFCSNNAGAILSRSNFKLYNFKMYDNDVLVRDYIPCYRISDNVIGLYDLVNNVFYTNQGTGTFAKGSNVSIPNPNYPQEIHNVSGDNTIEICGKNLLNVQNLTTQATYVCPCKIGDTFTFSFTGYGTANDKRVFLRTYDGTFTTNLDSRVDNEVVSLTGTSANYTITLTSTINGFVYIRLATATSSYILSNLQVEKGSTVTTYEAYTGQSQLISLGNIELNKISTYQDYIYKENDRWFLHKEIGKVVFNGSESYWNYDNGNAVFNNNNPSIRNYLTQQAYSNYFKNVVDEMITSNYRAGTILNSGEFSFRWETKDRLYLKFTNITSVDDLKTWLSTHNLIVYYILAPPTDTEITDTTLLEQLNRLMTLPLYKNMTHITLTPNDLQPTMKIEYYRDTSINNNYLPREEITKYYTKTETIAQIQIGNSSIQQSVAEMQTTLDSTGNAINTISNQVQTLQSSTSLQINAINTQLENGVEKVKTRTGFTFDDEGMSITKGEQFKNLNTDRNVQIISNGKEISFMGYDDNLKKTVARVPELESARATIGVHRCETITKNSKKRTAWFYVGGGN